MGYSKITGKVADFEKHLAELKTDKAKHLGGVLAVPSHFVVLYYTIESWFEGRTEAPATWCAKQNFTAATLEDNSELLHNYFTTDGKSGGEGRFDLALMAIQHLYSLYGRGEVVKAWQGLLEAKEEYQRKVDERDAARLTWKMRTKFGPTTWAVRHMFLLAWGDIRKGGLVKFAELEEDETQNPSELITWSVVGALLVARPDAITLDRRAAWRLAKPIAEKLLAVRPEILESEGRGHEA
jgi:hypothetical protein